MGILKLEDIVQATGGRVLCGTTEKFQGISIDSRSIREGELFVALKGDNFDGHDFINSALIMRLRRSCPVFSCGTSRQQNSNTCAKYP